jgi:sigma54-dependent transcription regulator
MAAQLQFPLYALAEFNTAQTVFGEAEGRRRLLLFTTAEKASRYRRMHDLAASVVRLKETRDVRTLLSAQDDREPFDVEIDPDEA